MSDVNVADFCAAVKYVARRTGDPDLAHDAAEHVLRGEYDLTSPLRPLFLSVAWSLRRKARLYRAREHAAMAAFAAQPRAVVEEPEQEAAVLRRELTLRADLAPIFAAGADRRRVSEARSRAGELLAA